jgi:hypothetical protein
MRTNRPRTDWKRVPNTWAGKEGGVGNKYNFSKYLRRVGDYIKTNPASREEIMKLKYAVLIWAYRHKCRVKTEMYYYPDGYGMEITLVSHTRKKPK